MKLLAKLVTSLKSLTIFAKFSVTGIWQGPKYVPAYPQNQAAKLLQFFLGFE